jgi:hypothetical protein
MMRETDPVYPPDQRREGATALMMVQDLPRLLQSPCAAGATPLATRV